MDILTIRTKYFISSAILTIVFISHAVCQTILWDNYYGAPESEFATDMCKTSNGYYAVIGRYNYGNNAKPYLIIVDGSGSIITEKIYDTQYPVSGNKILETFDGGFLLTCRLEGNTGDSQQFKTHLIRTDNEGDTLWTHYYEWVANDVIQQNNNSFVVLGSYTHNDSNYIQLWSIDIDGNELWEKRYSKYFYHDPRNIIKSSTNFLYVASWCRYSDSYHHEIWLIKLNIAGDLVSERSYCEGDGQSVYGLIETSGGDILLYGHTWIDNPMLGDRWILKTSSDCDSIWSKLFSSPEREVGLDITELPDGSFATIGYRQVYPLENSTPHLLFTKISSDGEFIEEIQLTQDLNEIGQDIEYIDDNTYVILSSIMESNGDIRILSLLNSSTNITNVSSSFSRLHKNYPNPFNPTTTIQYELPQRSDVQITIYDLLGRELTTLVSETQEAGHKYVQWDASEVSSGMYLYQIRAGEFVQTRKMVLLK